MDHNKKAGATLPNDAFKEYSTFKDFFREKVEIDHGEEAFDPDRRILKVP